MVAFRVVSQLRLSSSKTLAAGGACLGILSQRSPSTSCTSEYKESPLHPKRRRPPKFGGSVPVITSRGIESSTIKVEDMNSEREDCPICKKFGSGPCGNIFTHWLECTDQHRGADSSGHPIHLTKCLECAEKLAACLEKYNKYYESQVERDRENNDDGQELEAAWSDFVSEMESDIKEGKYVLQPFPEKLSPSIQIRLESHAGAAFFKPHMDNGSPLIVAYILDNHGHVLAAGAKHDMIMTSQFGCALRFDLFNESKSATCRAIYETESDSVTIFFKTLRVPSKK